LAEFENLKASLGSLTTQLNLHYKLQDNDTAVRSERYMEVIGTWMAASGSDREVQ
jgi:hypothetical protein